MNLMMDIATAADLRAFTPAQRADFDAKGWAVVERTPGRERRVFRESEAEYAPVRAPRARPRTNAPRRRELRSRPAARPSGDGGADDDEGAEDWAAPGRVLPGTIEHCSPEVEDAALRRFVEGMTRLATRLLLNGALDAGHVADDLALRDDLAA